MSLTRARAARRRAIEQLRARGLEAAVGLAREGEGYVLKVVLSEPLPAAVRLPRRIEGVPLRSEVVGAVRARRRR